MEQPEARAIVRLCQAGWPSRTLEESTASLWASLYEVAGESFADCRLAVGELLAESKWCPQPAEVLERAREVRYRRAALEAASRAEELPGEGPEVVTLAEYLERNPGTRERLRRLRGSVGQALRGMAGGR